MGQDCLLYRLRLPIRKALYHSPKIGNNSRRRASEGWSAYLTAAPFSSTYNSTSTSRCLLEMFECRLVRLFKRNFFRLTGSLANLFTRCLWRTECLALINLRLQRVENADLFLHDIVDCHCNISLERLRLSESVRKIAEHNAVPERRPIRVSRKAL
jgi:hypothetical protein